MARIGVLALARPTFDVPFAEENAAKAFAALDRSGHAIIGGRALLFDAAAAEEALGALRGEALDLLLILQVTFTDATMTVQIAMEADAPLAIWAFPEPRTGGRLRLNAFCGLNLAAHALGRASHALRWLYAAPDAPTLPAEFDKLIASGGGHARLPSAPEPTEADAQVAERALSALRGARIGLLGEHPPGFDTCRYEPAALRRLAGTEVDRIPLAILLARARAIPAEEIAETRASVSAEVADLDMVDQAQLDRSLSVYRALDGLARGENFKALAVRCWPEMFTEYGCAACGPMGFMNGDGIPSACEADVYGALSALALQELAGEPAFLADVVDMDGVSDTGVVWHCGLAPLSMADPATPPTATVHSNRRMPLLQEFALKPGRVTVARFSQARGEPKLVVAGATMVSAPKSFSGTSGVIRFDRRADEVAAAMMDLGLEHHVALVYRDVRGPLRAMGAAMGIPVVELA
jgi:L-fucose isomerase-like protein